jgi:ssDNA-specific exonuclease RecJ
MLRNASVRPCKYCGKLFATKNPQRRKFCCLEHQRHFNLTQYLKRLIAAGKIPPDDWRVELVKRIERKIRKLREETAKKLGISVEELERMIEAFEAQPNADAQHSNERRGDLK